MPWITYCNKKLWIEPEDVEAVLNIDKLRFKPAPSGIEVLTEIRKQQAELQENQAIFKDLFE